MGEFSWAVIFIITATSLCTALLSVYAMAYLKPKRKVIWDKPLSEPGVMTFLFENNELVNASQEGKAFLANGPETLAPWPRFLSQLSGSFPTIGIEAAQLPEKGTLELASNDGASYLEAECRAGLTRFKLTEGIASVKSIDSFSLAAMSDELNVLRAVVDDAPVLAWREDKEHQVTWANGAYIGLLHRMNPDRHTLSWPLPRAFEATFDGEDRGETHRHSITIPYLDQEIWYDCTARQIDDEVLVFATPADRLVQAERSRMEFLQTLTKTFADLPIGLAVFDRMRQLALFNPALTDLSALEPQFLSSRPTLVAFLDHLREAQRMPEPKDYKTWRRNIAQLESAASEGIHQEIWTLPTGHTYRITGQPHPDGAIALLFEDISAEMSLTRRFRSELELGQAVVDSLDEAIAVFSHSGSMVLCNSAYQEMWDCDLSSSLSDITVHDSVRDWSTLRQDPELWTRALHFISQVGDRSPWQEDLSHGDDILKCRFAPITGGATLVGFSGKSNFSVAKTSSEQPALPSNTSSS